MARGWGQPLWEIFEKWAPKGLNLAAITPERAKEELVLKFLRTNGVLSVHQLDSLF